MESLLLPLGLLGLAAFIGGIVGFFSLFSSSNKDGRLKALERATAQLDLEITKLNVRLETMRKALESQPAETSAKQSALNIETAAITIEPLPDLAIEPDHSADPVAEDDLIQQALAAEDVRHADDLLPDTPANLSKTSSENTSQSTTKRLTTPATPTFIEKGITAARNWLLGGNTLVRSGIVILFIGISFLLKYAAERTHVPIELRLTGIALFGIGLLALGWRLRYRRKEYSWALQGGGVGILYLTIFAALKLYQLLPAGAAFAMLAAVAFLSALIAVLQFSLPLAMIGFTGGFLAPILTSTGHGSHVGLFSYYLVLNLAIAFITYLSAFVVWKNWRPLNLLGFAFTFVIGALWGAENYQPALFSSTEPFLIIHFLLFTAIAVLYADSQSITKSKDYVDATLVFGTPLVGFSLQYALLRDSHFGLAYSALALGVFYTGLAWWILKHQHTRLKFLGECFLALGIGFITLTLPLALDGRWTSAAWAVEGVGLLWVGLRQHRTLPTFTGLALQLLAAIAFTKGWGLTDYVVIGHQNMFLGVAFIALSGWACGALLNANPSSRFSSLSNSLAFWGWVWWIGAGLTAIDKFLIRDVFMHAGLAFVALTSLLIPYVANTLRWQKLATLSALLLPAMTFTLLLDYNEPHPFAHFGGISWLMAFAIYAITLQRNIVPQGNRYRSPLLWIAAIIGAWEWQYQLAHFVHESPVWREIGWAVVPILIVAGATKWLNQAADAMASGAARAWAWLGCAPLAAFLMVWFMWMSLYSSGNAAPLMYVPLINPLDISLTAILLLLLLWQHGVGKPFNPLHKMTPILAGLMSFTLINGILLRTLHHWAATPFRWTAIFDTPLVQMSFTFLWGISAFALMLLAHHRAQRKLWVIGAGLMGIVVAKIFLLDMAQTGSVERIISFIGAGLMLLVMGYFAPLPPLKMHDTALEKA